MVFLERCIISMTPSEYHIAERSMKFSQHIADCDRLSTEYLHNSQLGERGAELIYSANVTLLFTLVLCT